MVAETEADESGHSSGHWALLQQPATRLGHAHSDTLRIGATPGAAAHTLPSVAAPVGLAACGFRSTTCNVTTMSAAGSPSTWGRPAGEPQAGAVLAGHR